MIALLTSLAIRLAPLLDARIGTGTTFDVADVDPGNPTDVLACHYPRRLQVGDLGVASYALPCGSRVVIWHAGRAIVVPVIDRGPRRTMRRPELQRTDLDLTVATARAIGFQGGEIVWAPIFDSN